MSGADSLLTRYDAWLERYFTSLRGLTGIQRAGHILNISNLLFYGPMTILAAVWLAGLTDFSVIRQHSYLLAVMLVINFLLGRLQFQLSLEIRPGVLVTSSGTLGFLVTLSGVLILGPAAAWLLFVNAATNLFTGLFRRQSTVSRIGGIANALQSVANNAIGLLAAIWVYGRMGGSFPLDIGHQPALLAAIGFLMVDALLPFLVALPVLILISALPDITDEKTTPLQLLVFIFVSGAIPSLAGPFSLLGAGIYVRAGVWLYIFYLVGVLMVNLLASNLSNTVQQRTRRSREMAALEALGRAIIASDPVREAIPPLLDEHIKNMFLFYRCRIWLDQEEIIYQTSQNFTEWSQVQRNFSEMSGTNMKTTGLLNEFGARLDGLLLPITSQSGGHLGGIYFAQDHSTSVKVTDSLPALQTLAAQIASALQRIDTHQEMLNKERMRKELELAGRIQANFLPESQPEVSGYEIAASLIPALQTSGDFYDFIELDGGRLGLVVADVTDKGTAAALFMALSRTLLRTYAIDFPLDPVAAMQHANQRILSDTQSPLFVTIFFAVLDPQQHTLTYINGGHNPALLLRQSDGALEILSKTGIPLGIFEDARWESRQVSLQPGDVLTMFTDGIPEASGPESAAFGDERLQAALKASFGLPAGQVQQGLLQAVSEFTQGAPQSDDITLLVVRRSA